MIIGPGHGLGSVAYSHNMPPVPTRFSGDITFNGRGMQIALHQTVAGDMRIYMALFGPAPPATVLAGMLCGAAVVTPEPEPSAARIILIRLPAPSPAFDALYTAFQPEESIADDLALAGMQFSDRAEVDRRIKEYLPAGPHNGIEQIATAEYRELVEYFNREHYARVAALRTGPPEEFDTCNLPGTAGWNASAPRQTGLRFSANARGPLELILALVEPLDGRQLLLGDEIHGRLERQALGPAQGLLDRGEDQRRAIGQQPRNLAGAWQQAVGGQDLVDQAPALGLGGLHPAAGEQQVHGDMVGDAPRQLDRGGVRQRAGVDLGQAEADMLGRQDQVAGQRQLEAAADRHAVEGGDHRLVEVGQLLQPAEAADAIVGIGPLAASAAALRSQPALKNFSPPPVTMATRSPGRRGRRRRRCRGRGWWRCRWRWPWAGRARPPGCRRPRVVRTASLMHSLLGCQSDQDIGRDGTLAGGPDDQGIDVELDEPVGVRRGEARPPP